jgi:hypothetical protein
VFKTKTKLKEAHTAQLSDSQCLFLCRYQFNLAEIIFSNLLLIFDSLVLDYIKLLI